MDLERFNSLYTKGHAFRSGAASILNSYFGFPVDAPVPLSLSHGVDFSHCDPPMDVHGVEPVHWCYNAEILGRSRRYKPVASLPHPWLMLRRLAALPEAAGTLVIGPPPGPENDRRLLELLKGRARSATILVKKRGRYSGSLAFWEAAGYQVVSAGDRPGGFYSSLFELISRHRNVISGTFSSALVFAAALGKDTNILEGYRYRSYFPSNYLQQVDFRSNLARAVVATFAKGTQEEKVAIAASLLGERLLDRKQELRAEYVETTSTLEIPCHGLSRVPDSLRMLAFYAAASLGRPGVAKLNRTTFEKVLGRHEVLDVDIDETSIWLQGLNETNFASTPVRFAPGVTELGWAVDQYGAS